MLTSTHVCRRHACADVHTLVHTHAPYPLIPTCTHPVLPRTHPRTPVVCTDCVRARYVCGWARVVPMHHRQTCTPSQGVCVWRCVFPVCTRGLVCDEDWPPFPALLVLTIRPVAGFLGLATGINSWDRQEAAPMPPQQHSAFFWPPCSPAIWVAAQHSGPIPGRSHGLHLLPSCA